MPQTPRLDGSLYSWQEVKKLHRWGALFLGNGLSMNVWPDFGYKSLYERALMRLAGGLTTQDRRLFAAHDTTNFEVVLAALNTSITTLKALNYKTTFLLDSYQSIRAGLGEAVRDVHPSLSTVDHTRETIQRMLLRQRVVFTTNYDLIVYWAMGYGEHEGNAYKRLVDLFWNERCSFDPANAEVRAGATPVYFLHGGMHLLVEGSGRTRKLKRGLFTVLEQFGTPPTNDPRARPLLITEGSSAGKLTAIENNVYLAHAIRELRRCRYPLVVFGSSFGEQDQHLLDAINENPERAVAVSMRRGRGGKAARKKKQGLIASRFATDQVYFYDAATHPLGASDLSAVVDLEDAA